MNDILEWLVTAEDPRQQSKVKYLTEVDKLLYYSAFVDFSELAWDLYHLFPFVYSVNLISVAR